MSRRIAACALLATCLIGCQAHAAPLGTAVTYQGQIKRAGVPYSGSANFAFTLYDSSAGGAIVAGPVILLGISVAQGLFTVQIDFGSTAFVGDERWLAITVNTPADGLSYTNLSPRQRLAGVPYALGLRLPAAQTLNSGLEGLKIENAGLGHGISGTATSNTGVVGLSNTGAGVEGMSNSGIGVAGQSLGSSYGVWGYSVSGVGVYGESNNSDTIYAYANVPEHTLHAVSPAARPGWRSPGRSPASAKTPMPPPIRSKSRSSSPHRHKGPTCTPRPTAAPRWPI